MRGLCQEDVRIIVEVLAERLQDVLQVSKQNKKEKKADIPKTETDNNATRGRRVKCYEDR